MSGKPSEEFKRSWMKENIYRVGSFFNSRPYFKGILALIATLGTLALGFAPSEDRPWYWYVTSAAVVVLAAIPPICEGYWEVAAGKDDDTIAVRKRVLSSHIASTINSLADEVDKDKTARESFATNLAKSIIREVVSGFADKQGVRCSAFKLSNDKNKMTVIDSFGRGDWPRDFVRNNERGKQAIEWLLDRNDAPEFVPNTRIEDVGSREGASKYYETFISIPIKTAKKPYGMLTIDAPRVGDLDESDTHLLAVYASIIALAMAEGQRGARKRGTSGKR